LDQRSLRMRSGRAPAFAAALGVLAFGGSVARAQALPACVAGNNNQTACSHGNIIFSNPTGIFASGYWRSNAATISDPFNPGFSTGNIVETSASGQISQSGSFTVATLDGLAAIAGLSVSSTCGVTAGATASLSVTTNNGSNLMLNCPQITSQVITHELSTVTQSVVFSAPVSSLQVTVTGSGANHGGSVTWTDVSGQLALTPVYYFPHLAFGGGFQTTLTFVNYSPQAVTCQTTFLSDSGTALMVPFAAGAVPSRSDNLPAGGTIHVQTQAPDTLTTGWAYAQCTGPVKTSLLYRLYNNGAPQGEAGVNALSAPAREFVTFGESHTGVAWANPSTMPATVTITAMAAATGQSQGSTTFNLPPNGHGAANIGPLLNLPGTFSGSVEITSTVPIVSPSLNAEAYPAFSSLPPGDLPDGTPLAGTH
jgi:hypothetical protein